MKKILTIFSISLFILISVVHTNAATVIYHNGLYFEEKSDGTYIVADYDGASDVVIPGTLFSKPVTSIKARAFRNKSELTSLSFSSAYNLMTVNMYAFAGCSGIESVLIPASVGEVGISVFKDCTGLKDAAFYGNENKVPNETFSGCSNLESVRLSDNVVEIGAYAFANCTELKYLELPISVSFIGNDAFQNDKNIVLGVYCGSYAHQYAVNNNISFKLLDHVRRGDANGDEFVSIMDVTCIQRHIADLIQLEGIYLYAADTNVDGIIDIDDASFLQMYLAHYQFESSIWEIISE